MRGLDDSSFAARAQTIYSTLVVLTLLTLSTTAMAQAEDPGIFPNIVGGGIGSTPDYSGARSRGVAFAPLLRYQFEGSRRTINIVGPSASANLLESEHWQAGPMLHAHSGRSGVDDAVLAQIHEVGDTVEGGGYVGYAWNNTDGVPWRLRVSVNVLHDLGNVSKGTSAALGGQFFLPVHSRLILGLGGSLNLADRKYMDTYYGMTGNDAAASGLPAYDAGGGLRSRDVWFGALWVVSPSWIAGAGVYWQQLVGPAADSPIVRNLGRAAQASYGLGAAYVWH